MKRLIAGLLPLISIACASPQYTVMQATPVNGVTVDTSQAVAWPDIGQTEATGASSQDVAVLIAIEDYAFLPDVPGAIENANAWENYLRKTKGFKEVFVLTDKQAPVEEIRRFTQQAVAAAPEGGALWFVFIGHGAALKDGSDGALIGMDAQQTIESIGTRGLARKELLSMLARGRQAETVVVLDTCFSGRDSGGELLAQGTQPVIPVNAAPQIGGGTVVLSAAGNDEVAGQLPGAERPAFSYLLLGALRGWADDGDGQVSAEEAVTWTRQQLRHVKGRQQTPAADGDKSMALAANATEADPGIAALMKGGGSAPASQTPVTITAPQGGDLINTNKGLVFVKPQEWGVGPVGMGIVLNLMNQYSGNAIVVTKMKVKQSFAAQMLGAPTQYQSDSTELQILRKSQIVSYGSTKGQEMEYKLIDRDSNFPSSDHRIKFGTYQNGVAWSFELVVANEETVASDYEAFKRLLEGVQFLPPSAGF